MPEAAIPSSRFPGGQEGQFPFQPVQGRFKFMDPFKETPASDRFQPAADIVQHTVKRKGRVRTDIAAFTKG
jgi:hypothetical protein